MFLARRRRRRNRFAALVAVLLVIAAGAAYISGYAPSGALGGEKAPSAGAEGSSLLQGAGRVISEKVPELGPEPVPEAAKETPEGAAYWTVASEHPGMSTESINAVNRSKLDPSWASEHFVPSGE